MSGVSAYLLLLILATVHLNLGINFAPSKNKVTFERVTCKTYPGSTVSQVYCRVKYVDRYHLKVDTWCNITKPIDELILHVLMWYRYNTYQPIGGQIHENICDWLGGKGRFFVLDWIVSQISKYTNMNHPCPLSGKIYFKVDNISVDSFAFPQIVPAGRYRIDVSMLESKGKVLYDTSIYFSVSDHRLEVV